MEKVVEGLRRYQLHPYQRPPQRASIIWSDGEARILWYAASPKSQKNATVKKSILMIPSMINGAEILDILPEERSFIRWLSMQGFDVFVLEWGNLREDPELASLDSAGVKLVRALTWLKSEIDTPLCGIGYCMGGLFLAVAETLTSNVFDSLVFIATPWNFKAGAKGNFAEAVSAWAPDVSLREQAHRRTATQTLGKIHALFDVRLRDVSTTHPPIRYISTRPSRAPAAAWPSSL